MKKIIHILGKNTQPKIYGRNVVVKPINKDDTDIFLNHNHIQGSQLLTTINLGAFHDEKLIGVMSFVKRNKEKKNDKDTYWELTRYATDINSQCVGVADKLFKHFIKEKENTTVISFADRGWTPNQDNNLYTNLGFKLIETLYPDYSYLNGKIVRNKRIHKLSLKKEDILRIKPDLKDKDLSTDEMAISIGCTKIWDCGLFKYEFVIKPNNK